ncbi:hypothetical protein [Mycobacterium sp. 236(2023)]|uniref:hypothetical protein n=1 Tax=Mycobacterium sp. 236(2023) TaxID=3038163 RepID=UPI002415068D|nr:hypothetical protein [Mycobacterium sp. 236(2023)]MDG4669190.1 hypothetical protein [Mycobacterium sp. 236(2023)]
MAYSLAFDLLEEMMTVEDATDEVTTDERDATDDDVDVTEDDADDAETFPAHVVKELREKNGKYRTRARDAEARVDELSRALFTARVTATGKLASADELEYNAELLDDDDALNAAIDDLLVKRPHYAARKVTGDVGQGLKGKREEKFSLLGRLQQSV